MPSFLFFFFYVGVCSIICVRRKTRFFLSNVGVFLDNCRHEQKCVKSVLAPSETKLQKGKI